MSSSRILLGRNGLLGAALWNTSVRNGVPIESIPWTNRHTLLERVRSKTEKVDVLFASGLTNPKSPKSELDYSNTDFPIQTWQQLKENPQVRIITFGSIHETIPELCRNNNYLQSKNNLATFWVDHATSEQVTHFRLHTLYGIPLPPHMFLGQLIHALSTRSQFKMSSGLQWREYYSADQAAAWIHDFLAKKSPTDEKQTILQTLTFGRPIQLRTLATRIFEYFGRSNDLILGTEPMADHEPVSQPLTFSNKLPTRNESDSISEIISFIETNFFKSLD